MAFTQEDLDAVKDTIRAVTTGGAVKAYTLPDGTNIQLFDLKDLWELHDRVSAEVVAQSSPGRRVGLFSLRPFR